MNTTIDDQVRTACELIRMLHDGEGTDRFLERLAAVEALPIPATDRATLLDTVRMALALRSRLELQQERERGLLAVIESAQDLSRHLDLEGLLSAIVLRARDLLKADVAWLSIFDKERDEFRVIDSRGALRESTSRMIAKQDRGVASVVMATRLPFTTSDYLQDTRFPHDPVLDATFREEGLMALAGVPLMRDAELIGLLFVADRYPRSHTAQAISILCTLATHAAVAIRNARDFEQASAALAAASRMHAEFERYARGIQAAADAHEQMTTLLARGASLATLCQSVAQLLGGAVLVLDEASKPAGRGRAKGCEVRGDKDDPLCGPRSTAIAKALHSSRHLGRSVVAYEHDGETCRVMAVIGGEGVLGSLLLFHAGELEDVLVRTFERSSSVVGIMLLSQERIEAARHRDASTLLRSLTFHRPEEAATVASRAERQGFDLQQDLVLALLKLDGISASYATRSLRGLDGLSDCLVDQIDGHLVLLGHAAAATDLPQRLTRWSAQQSPADFRGVVSRSLRTAGEVPAAYATLVRALSVLERMAVQRTVLAQNELALYSALFETHDRSSLLDFLDATIGPVLVHDRKRGLGLAATLLAYFDANQNATATAERLGIHVNTVRQRLATIEDLLGDWTPARRSLEIHMALRLWALGVGASGP